MSRPLWILVSGKRFTGKDTIANGLQQRLGGTRGSFAAQVKAEAAKIHNLDAARLTSDSQYKEEHRLKLIAHGKARREEDLNYWVKKALEAHAGEPLVIISDDRFPNERQCLVEHGVRVITVRAMANEQTREARGWKHNEAVDTDTGECALDDAHADYSVPNYGQSLDALDDVLNLVAETIKMEHLIKL